MRMSLTHRLQLLLEESQYERLAHRAAAEGRSVGALVREAIDLAWAQPDAQRRSALDTVLGAELMQVPTVDELKAEIDDLRAGGFA
jgi:plasmid stability protein